MKKISKIFCLILVFMFINTSCVKRRIDYLEARKNNGNTDFFDFNQDKEEFDPDNIDKFDASTYLIWYKNLDKPPKLMLKEPTKAKTLTNKEMVEDFNYVFKQLKENYPFFDVLKRSQNVDFLGNYDKYLQRIKKSKNEEEFIDQMTGIIGELKNSHARIADKNYVDYILKYYANNWNSPSIYYEFLNLNKTAVRNRYDLKGVQSLEKSKGNKHKSLSLLENNSSSNMTLDTSVKDIAIIRIKQMLDPEFIKKDEEILNEFLKNKHLYKALVLDIRGNYGGNMEYWQKFLLPKLFTSQKEVTNHLFFKESERSKLILADDTLNIEKVSNVDLSAIKLEHAEDLKKFDYYIRNTIVINPDESDKNNGYEGKIYLLVDRKVFSAAEGFASFMKNSKSATLVGQDTGGDGITLGVLNDVMPNSGLVFTYTNTLGYSPDGKINAEDKTKVDIKSDSYRNSIDTIEEVLDGDF
ncbi:S41 family peptidase [Anaerococcus sp. Marseille-P3625]|uniref:S41 family peptidase n=1 Tax=Anaerococcus sp. Marseille-P3625 TaxID=1977277 RepID=UPI000C0790ED|nr:S41 family peptidase [Anaerococcus sp. Marseille-P3625]